MKVKINVTQEHIDNGVRESSLECPVALSLTEKGYDVIVVDSTYIIFQDKNHKEYVINLSPDDGLWNFIDDFDNLYEVDPFSLTVEALPNS